MKKRERERDERRGRELHKEEESKTLVGDKEMIKENL